MRHHTQQTMSSRHQLESRPPNTTQLLDLGQAAAYLTTSERHLRRLWQERRIAAIKVGRGIRFTESDLNAFIDRNRHSAVR
jgi:excisionase family DNA binding protein